jgi:hypothetical protein
MAGLLDYSPDPLSMGLLGMGASLMTPRAMGGGVGPGMQAFAQQAMQAQMMRRQMQQDALRQRVLEAQIGEYGAQTEERRARAAKAQREAEEEATRRKAQEEFWASLSGGNRAVIAQTGGLAPTNANAALRNQPMPIGQGAAIAAARAGIPLETLERLSGARNWGRDKVAGTVETTDAQGRPVTRMRTDYGDFIGDALPKPYERKTVDIGGSILDRDPYTGAQLGAIPKTFTPGERDASARGWASNAIARERLAMDKQTAGADGGFQYIQTPTGLVAVPKKPGEGGAIASRPVVDAQGLAVGGERNTAAQTKVTEANDALSLIDQAEKLIDRSTGSYAGAGVDMAAQVLGVSTPGAQAAAQLKALQGALVSKMPKMSGPQSDKDVQLYREMAGQVGDPTIPAATKKAALQTIREIQERYAGMQPGASRPKPPEEPKVPEQAFASLPAASQYRGKVVRDTLTGKAYKSNGMSWVEQ